MKNELTSLPCDLSPHLLLVLQTVVKNLYLRFDMSPIILKSLLTDSEFISWIINKFNQLEEEILGNLMNRPQIMELRELYKSDQPIDILFKHLGWEQDQCGYIIERHSNGYQEYCNLSRFQHLNNQHEFVRKTYQHIIDEKLFDYRFEAYQEFLDTMLKCILDKINSEIKNSYHVYRYTTEQYNPKVMTPWLKRNHPTVFKSKMGFYQQDTYYLDIYVPIRSRVTVPNNPILLE